MDDEQFQLEKIFKEESVETLFQPIVDLKTGEAIGYEALSRGPAGSLLYAPLALISAAHTYGKILELEMLFRKKALENAVGLGSDKYLFINIDPEIIKSPGFKSGLTMELLEQLDISESNIVFEITERTAIGDMDSFRNVLDNYRSQGYMIAIDDAGAGYSGLKTIHEVRPNFIKIDMDLIRNIDKDSFKQSLLKALVEVSLSTNIKIVAEGIENEEELKTLILLGVHAGQGYYLGKPEKVIQTIAPSLLTIIESYKKISGNLNEYHQDYHYIHNLVNASELSPYEPMAQCQTIKSILEKDKKNSVCICENGYPVGLVMKAKLDEKLSGLYGYSLYSNRPIDKVMNKNPLIVDLYTPINVVAKKAMERSDDDIYDDVIVTKAMKFFGIVNMKRIFEYTLMMEKNSAKEHNPLTGLPGNPVINRVISDLATYRNDTFLCYLDLNDFKIYNDVYGFENGDKMIRMVAKILHDTIKVKFPHSSFIGHIGGDDFIVVLNNVDQGESAINEVLNAFELNKIYLFSDHHRTKGKILSKDRFGIERSFNLTSLSVSVISGDLSVYRNSGNLTTALAALKKETKLVNRSSYKIVEAECKKICT